MYLVSPGAGGVAAFLTTPLDVFSLKVMTRLDKKMQAVLSEYAPLALHAKVCTKNFVLHLLPGV